MKMDFKVNTELMTEKTYQTKLKKILWLSMNRMKEIAKDKCPKNTGLLKRSIRLIPEIPGSSEYVLTDGVDYGIHMEYGTRPHWMPIDPLKSWANLKLGDSQIAYAIRAHIAKYGVDAHPFFRPALIEVRSIWIPKYFKDVMNSTAV